MPGEFGIQALTMQFYAEDLVGDRPVPPEGCPGHLGKRCRRQLHRHECYLRYRSVDSVEKDAATLCFRCPLCKAHFSVIPQGMMPYYPLPSDDAQRYADQRSQFVRPTTEEYFLPSGLHLRILQRFWAALSIYALSFAGLYSWSLDSGPSAVWCKLRQRFGSISAILIALHAHHTSLTKNYLSLKPWWLGGLARGWRATSRAP